MYGLLNLGSLIFGMIAWMIPAFILVKKKNLKDSASKGIFYSLGTAIISLFMQSIYTKHLVDINDWSALLDTQDAVVLASSVLVFIAIALSGLVLYRSLNCNEE